MIGQTISHYKILAKLGEGGMGVVYKAHDTTLDRDVALKFLPRDISPSEEEHTRFIHEAKAASALDHPNICTIYEVGQTPDGQMFIVMGYYEGRSISKMVEKGRLDVAEAVSIAIQIAEGLQAAHEKGIVHRDIKSSNIIVSDKGQVRILDFGLARRKGLSRLTKTGTTVGTAMYMSPEQAQGESVDHRTDLWSLGVVLYEMVTGRLPFRGDHEPAILYSVVNEEPQSVQNFVPDASPELVHILRCALEKDPAERYKSADDLLTDLRRLKKDTSRIGFPPVTASRKRASVRRRTIIAAAGGVLLLCIAGYFYVAKKGAEINVSFVQRTIDVPFQQNIRASISSSGKWVVFSAADKNHKFDLYVVSTSGGFPKRITNDSTPGPIFNGPFNGALSDPHVSSDDHDILYSRFRADGNPELCKVPLVGGQIAKIGEGLFGKWSRDGKRIGYIKFPHFSKTKKAEFWTVRPDGSENRREFIDTTALSEGDNATILACYFDWSPDGNSIAWLRRTKQFYCEILRHNLADGKESGITADSTIKTSLCWLTNGMIVYRSSGEDGVHIWAIPEKGGTPIQITRGTGADEFPSASLDGSMILFNGNRQTWDLWVGKLDGSDPEKVATIEGDVHYSPGYSPSRKQIVFPKSFLGSTTYNLAVIDRDGSNERMITRGEKMRLAPLWSPNGQWIVFVSRDANVTWDSAKVNIINPWTMESPRLIYGPCSFNGEWLSDSVLSFMYRAPNEEAVHSMRIRLDSTAPVQIAADSLAVWFVDDGKFVLYDDYRTRAGSNTERIIPVERWNRDGGVDPQIFDRHVPKGWKGGGMHGRSRFELWCDPEKGDLWKVWFPDARKELIKSSCDALKGIEMISMSWDENGYSFFSRPKRTSSIVLIENLFK